jgi:beta-phosphoglucomutase
MSQIKGIIFDFNGTLFWDSKLHEEAWLEFAQTYANKHLTDDDFKERVHGRINRDIIQLVFEKTFSAEEIQHYSDCKENIYRSYLLNDRSLLQLAPGAVEMLDYLKSIDFPITIATSAEISNVDFYFKNLGLPTWFDFTKVVYDNGKIIPKPAPDIFLKAANTIGIDPKNCLVVEDSITGIMSARNAGIGTILFIENDEPVDYSKIKDLVYGRITNLLQLKEYLVSK